MSKPIQIGPVQAGMSVPDREIIALWKRSFGPEFQLDEALWQQNTAKDPSFLPSDIILARDGSGTLLGFVVVKIFRDLLNHPGEKLERYAGFGYIAAIAVSPEQRRKGLGRELLAQAETYLADNGATTLYVGESFRHFFPGVPVHNRAAVEFFAGSGYELGTLESDLDGPLDPAFFEPVLKASNKVTYRQGLPGEEAALLSFLSRTFPGRWHYDTRLFLEQGGSIEDVSLVIDLQDQIQGFLLSYKPGDKVIGPGRYWLNEKPDWGGIGPLGLNKDARGLGAGLGVVAAGMQHLYRHGLKSARIDWTTLVDFYGKLGFKPALTYQRATRPIISKVKGEDDV
ncbi:MAG: hypothetical protein JWP00_2028 [Chloroflexi bacterium]|nr:hypothetical protein [Chloroflexota bacterium]